MNLTSFDQRLSLKPISCLMGSEVIRTMRDTP